MAVIPISISKADKVLIVSPHPDDESIGVGGLLSLYPNQCDVVVVTNGGHGSRERSYQEEVHVRKEQFEKAMQFAGVTDYIWLGYPDGELMGKTDCVSTVPFERYTKVFIPWSDDNHPDHTAASIYAVEQIKKGDYSGIEVYQYEVHVPLHDITHYIDITSVITRKTALIKCHTDQVQAICYDEIAKSLAKYRACQENQPNLYFETYQKVELSKANDNIEISQREQLIQKYRQFYRLLLLWIKVLQSKRSIVHFLEDKNYRRVTVYGYSDIGKIVVDEIIRSKLQLIDILDKRRMKSDCEIRSPEDGSRDTNIVIVTAVFHYDEVRAELLRLGYTHVISLERILQSEYDS